MLQAYGKTPTEWGALRADVQYFLEQAWIAEAERKRDAQEPTTSGGLTGEGSW